MNKRASLVILASLLASTEAFAEDLCSVPASEWQDQAKVEAMLKERGWDVKRLKTEDGCYEAYALDADGQRIEAYIDPRSLDVVKVKRDD
ncbi:PepSY domain-containing protein [Marinobacter lacisalsi]|uniref:PepSY domain-containing protein n=1 Tax=Marinobacter lacisalsi TaxID=475979 RepID=A0ABV8QLE2_9GAMM